MRKYAIVNNDVVSKVLDLDDQEVASISTDGSMVIDIEDMIPQPQTGWLLEGNKLVPASASMTADERDSFQQTAQRQFGLKLLPIVVDKLGARNLKLTREAVPVDVASLATQMSSIKLLLETGALKTVRGICSALKPAFPNHSDILDDVIIEISNFLVNNGFE